MILVPQLCGRFAVGLSFVALVAGCTPAPIYAGATSPMHHNTIYSGGRPVVLLSGEGVDRATLSDSHGVLCELPCTILAPREPGPPLDWHVDLEVGEQKQRIDAEKLAQDRAGDGVDTVVAVPKRGHPGGALGMLFSGIPLFGIGGLLLALAPGKDSGWDDNGTLRVEGVTTLVIASALVIGGIAWFEARYRPQLVELTGK